MRCQLIALLDETERLICDGAISSGFNRLVDGLAALEAAAGPQRFRSEMVPACLDHPIRPICHQEPITRHAFTRPRGYAGDAGLIDLYYGLAGPSPDDTDLGRELYRAVASRSGGESVRYRRSMLASRIDAVATAFGRQSRVLSVACGHFREGSLSQAVVCGRVGRVVCLDQDPRSIDLVREEMAGRPVEPVAGSVRWLLSRESDAFGRYHFIYAAGLYDYLSDPMAGRLTARLFELLHPGGSLLVANFLPETAERSYMAAFMNWDLRYRSAAEVRQFASLVAPGAVARMTSYPDPEGNVQYLEIHKK
ncbi:hypothetical protein OJF2_02880 [Aquisphaera giovannonii]|uniref:Methyltransferase domain protein n=1 Tax=Aquisphaera giovannonii TaxID=406548 RepID=A0A5B9VTX9_9BACT|nr:class I SAM-dependent methyltransferase [Aquisphaera giovannonii]QEH31823.1 hypothetical protein OJF2_02880 [Aquisphaera giovannonii]